MAHDRRHIRSGWRIVLAFFAALLFGAMPERAQAQTPTISKTLCQGTTCGLQTVAPGAAVYYLLTLNNPSSTAAPVTIRDVLPTGFGPVSYGCAPNASAATATLASTAQTLVISPPVSVVPGSGQLQCVIAGTFGAGAVSGATNVAQIVDPNNHSNVLQTSNPYNNNVNLTAPLPSNLSVTKTASVASVNISSLPQTVTYTIAIANNGLEDVYLGQLLTLEDTLSLPPLGVVVHATFVSATCAVVPVGGGSDCLASVPVFMPTMPVLVSSGVPVPFARWRYPPSGAGSNGLLKAGHQMVLTVVVRLSRVPGVTCILAANADGADNHAHIVLTLPAAVPGGPITTISDGNAPDNKANILVHVDTGATLIDPACNAPYQPPSPVVKVTKVQLLPLPASAPHPWGTTVTYRVTVRNISTTPNLRIRNIRVEDWVVEGLETPPFTAQRMSYACTPFPCTPPTPLGPQQFLGNFDTHRMAGGGTLRAQSSGGLAFNQTASFLIAIRYRNPGCDSYPAMNPKTIFNLGRVIGWDQDVGGTVTQVNQIVQGAVVTKMRPVPACPLTVQKTSTSAGVILFNNNPNTNATTLYNIVYGNPTNQTFTMGTLGDMMRIVPNSGGVAPYAVQLRVDYTYTCTPIQGTVSGYPAANPNAGNSANPYDTAQVVVTQLPQQGVRLIRNLQPVVFGPNSKLQCSLFAWVHRPPANDPYCSTGQLQQAAVLDASIFYDPNSQWTGPPGMWASVVRPLPRCHNLVVNKVASPAWIWPGGGPLTWTLRVTNFGPAVIPANKLIVTDTLSNGLTATSSPLTCTPPLGCVPPSVWSPPPSSNPAVLNIGGMAANTNGTQLQTTLTVQNAPASVSPGGQVCNTATASVSQFVLPPHNVYYWKNPQTLSSNACIPVFAAGSLTVNKTLTNAVGAQLPANYAFPINVNCVGSGPQVAVNIAAGGSWSGQHIQAGSTCTISEGNLPVLAPTPTCAQPVWSTSYGPGAVVVIPQANNSSTTVTVANAITCAPPPTGTLVINKITIGGPSRPNFTTALFNVTCTPGGPTTVVSVPPNGQATVGNIPAPATCTLVEQPLPPQGGCNWVPTQAPPGPIAIMPGAATTVTVTNDLDCPVVPGQPGTLIIKKVTPLSAIALNFTAATFNVSCSSSALTQIVSVPANGQTGVSVPAPATCTIVEQPLPPLAGCPWVPTRIPPGTVAVASGATVTVTVVNTRLCGSSAGLVVNKRTVAPPGGAAVPASFQFNAVCTPGGTNTLLPAPANGLSPVLPVAGGATCIVAEQPPPPPAGCAWSVTQAPSGSVTTVPGAVTVVDATNNLVCNASFGTLAIGKTTTVPQGFALPASFLFNVNCGSGGLVTTVSVPANGQTQVPGILAPATCTVAELPPPPPSTPGCSWAAPTQIPPVAVAPGATVTVTAANQMVCNLGNLIVKNVTIMPAGMQPPALFPTHVSCSPGGPASLVSIPANNQFGFLSMPAPKTCTVSPQVPPPPAGCAWTVTQAPTGSVTVASGATVTVTITAQLACGLAPATATLLIRKFVMVNGATTPSSPATLPSSWATTFPITVTCGSHPPIAGNLNGANTYQTSIAASVGQTCTVQEAVPAFPSPNCHWSVGYPQGPSVAIAGGANTIDIYNTQVCP